MPNNDEYNNLFQLATLYLQRIAVGRVFFYVTSKPTLPESTVKDFEDKICSRNRIWCFSQNFSTVSKSVNCLQQLICSGHFIFQVKHRFYVNLHMMELQIVLSIIRK